MRFAEELLGVIMVTAIHFLAICGAKDPGRERFAEAIPYPTARELFETYRNCSRSKRLSAEHNILITLNNGNVTYS